MKVTIIGGGGRVGSNSAFCLQCAGIVSEIQILDANEALAEGEALDLMHGASSLADQRIYAGDYTRAANSDIFIITAGLRRKPDESRLDLINRNVSLFSTILGALKSSGMKSSAMVFVVSNPVDILTHLAMSYLDLPAQQVIGLGTMLDTARFRALIAEALNLAPTQVKALILGEHGDSMVPIWSTATVNGLSMTGVEGFTPNFQRQVFERTKGSGAEVIKRKAEPVGPSAPPSPKRFTQSRSTRSSFYRCPASATVSTESAMCASASPPLLDAPASRNRSSSSCGPKSAKHSKPPLAH